MTRARAASCVALACVLLAAGAAARAQSEEGRNSPALRDALAAYSSGDLATAEKTLRIKAASDPDAEAWLGAVLLDSGQNADDGLLEDAGRVQILLGEAPVVHAVAGEAL